MACAGGGAVSGAPAAITTEPVIRKKEKEINRTSLPPASNGTKHFTSLIILLVYLARQCNLGYVG